MRVGRRVARGLTVLKYTITFTMNYIKRSVALFGVVLMGCGDQVDLPTLGGGCPPDENLGKLTLVSPDFTPYKGNETLTYQNAAGNRVTLTNYEYTGRAQERQLVLSMPCYKSELLKQQIFYQTEHRSASYRTAKNDLSSSIYFSYGVEDMRVDPSVRSNRRDTVLAEVLIIHNNFTQPNTMLQVLASDRGNRSKFDLTSKLYNPYPEFVAYRTIRDTIISGRAYKDVFYSTQPSLNLLQPAMGPTIYFTRREGIIAFKDNQQWWYLRN